VQNLVGIDVVVSKIFCEFDLNVPIYAPKMFFLEI